MKKKIKLSGLALIALVFLSACSKQGLTANTPGIWNRIVYFFAVIIRWFSFGQSVAVGIILFTIVIRVLLLPLMNIQIKSSQKMQDLQPQLKAIQAKYPGRDVDSRQQMQEEQQRLYAENKVNPYAGCLPVLVQMPFLYALYQALMNVEFLKHGTFLWFNIGQTDHTFILPILAAVLTFLSSYLMMKSSPEQNSMTWVMTIAFPIIILWMGVSFQSGVALYWVISTGFQVLQTFLIANPYKIIAEREAKQQAIKDKEKAREKALRKAKRK